MNKLFYILFASLLVISCKEEDQPIVLDPSQLALFDSTYVSSNTIIEVPKNILMEEFSGVRCTNCPPGNMKTNEIYTANPDRINAVTVHSKFLAIPIGNDLDLRCVDAEILANTLGVSSKPNAVFNRKIISGSLASSVPNEWTSRANQILLEKSPVNISLETIFVNVEKRTFRYRITLKFAEAMENISLGFLLTESEIEATQEFPNDIEKEDYIHEFVLRKFITSVLGETITETITANTVIIKEYEIDLNDFEFIESNTNPIDWKINNMGIVAFVRAENDEILNSAKVDL